MAAQTNPSGWEPILKTAEPHIKSERDLLVVFIHWNLIKNQVRCVGVGEDMTFDRDDAGSELLPDNWSGSEKYSLRYVHNGELYLFFATFVGQRAIFNLLKCSDSKLCSFAIDCKEEVKSMTGPLADMLPNYEHLVFKLKKELLETIENKTTAEASAQTDAPRTQPQPMYGGPAYVPDDPLRVYREDRHRPMPGPPDYGMGDLRPGGIGGGMLFDPRMPRMPNRYVQVRTCPLRNRIRYDPINPLNLTGPGPDHMRPPDMDDMYL